MCVALNHGADRVVTDLGLVFQKTVPLELTGPKVALGDLELVLVGIARKLDDLHAGEECGRDRVEDVCRRDEEELREIERNVQIVVAEGMVLLRIENLEERGGGITAEVAAELVDLVEHEDRVPRLHPLDTLQDAPRQGADIGAAVPADLRLVTHAPECDARKVPVHRARDRAAEGGLPGSRRADEAEDRALQVLLELQDRDELENSLLDLLQAVVVFVEDLAGGRHVERVLGLGGPRQVCDPLEVGADRPGLHRARRLGHQPTELSLAVFADLVGYARPSDSLPKLLHLLRGAVVIAELTADRSGLLAQDVLALVPRELLLHLLADLLLQVAHLRLPREVLGESFEPGADLRSLEQLLLLFDRDVEMGRDHVGQHAGILNLHDQSADRVRYVARHPETSRNCWLTFRCRASASSPFAVSSSSVLMRPRR